MSEPRHTDAYYRQLLGTQNIPAPEGKILDLAYRTFRDDWYAKLEDGWYWFDRRGGGEWKYVPYGPSDNPTLSEEATAGVKFNAYVCIADKVKPGTEITSVTWYDDPERQAIEDALEGIRQEVAPDAPSRIGAIFLAPDIKAAEGWCGVGEKGNIYEVLMHGKYHIANGETFTEFHVKTHRGDIGGARAWGEDYWKASPSNMHTWRMPEIVLQGTAHVVRLVKKHKGRRPNPVEDPARFQELAYAQRGEPENAMNRIAKTQIAQIYSHLVEHVGDLTNRMAKDIDWSHGMYETIKEKLGKTLRELKRKSRKSVEERIEDQILSNIEYHRKHGGEFYQDPDEAYAELRRLGQEYAAAHAELPVLNHVQALAQQAAVALGEFRFKEATQYLDRLNKIVKKGRKHWRKAAETETREVTWNPYEELQERVMVANPIWGDDVSGYEGMRVEYTPTSQKFMKISNAKDLIDFALKQRLLEDTRERIYALYLDIGNSVLGYRLIGAGGISSAITDMRVAFGPAVALQAASVVIVHNHPSGRLKASLDDVNLARQVNAAANDLGIRMLDFIIVAKGGRYTAFSDSHPDLLKQRLAAANPQQWELMPPEEVVQRYEYIRSIIQEQYRRGEISESEFSEAMMQIQRGLARKGGG